MAYKKLIKVSNVCQLLDKSKYPASTTIKGVAVSAKDNAFYVTGTCIEYGGRNNKLSETIVLRPGRYYFYTFNASEAVPCLSKNINNSIIVSGNSNMFTVEETTECYFGINFVKDIVYSGYLKPQLFDLTEMYGAGHEPTTVEQFRQDFPEEMYDYSPHCWLTSYKRVFMTGYGDYLTSYQRNLTCKTKNLFDINSSPNLNNNSNITINGNSILCVARANNAHVSYKIPTVIGEKYTVSNKSIVRKIPAQAANYGIFISDNNNQDSSNYLPMGLMSGQSFTFTARTEFLYVHWYVTYGFNADNPNSIEINELQVELGDKATDYVPYGHL